MSQFHSKVFQQRLRTGMKEAERQPGFWQVDSLDRPHQEGYGYPPASQAQQIENALDKLTTKEKAELLAALVSA